MEILTFDVAAGRYAFRMSGLSTAPHRHPYAEVIETLDEPFLLEAGGRTHRSVRSAVVEAGVVHRVEALRSTLAVTCLEHGAGPRPDAEVYVANPVLRTRIPPDDRHGRVLAYVLSRPTGEVLTVAGPATATGLSARRLRELFVALTGVPTSEYLVYDRLRRAIAVLVAGESPMGGGPSVGAPRTLGQAGQFAGFHDAAHLTRSFRRLFGVAPSWGYDRRSVQGRRARGG